MPQLSIPDAPPVGYAGQIAEPGAPTFARSVTAEGALVVAGMPVKRGTDPQRQVEPFVAADLIDVANFAGLVVLETSRPQADLDIEDGDSLAVMRLGAMYLDFNEAVTAGEVVGLTLADGNLVGLAQGSASTALIQILPGVRIVDTIAAAGLAIVEIDLFGDTGATGGDFESGEYTPTLTNVTNVAASAVLGARYFRIGNVVTVYFSITIDVTSAAATELDMTLPVVSNLAAAKDLIGHANSAETVGEPLVVTGDSTNEKAQLSYTAVGTGVVTWNGSFSYAIL